MSSRRRCAAIVIGITAAVAGAATIVWLGLDPAAVHGPATQRSAELPDERVLSLLAVGDTGAILPWRPFGEGQRSVARGLVAEDRRAPVDALVLLGDNFYPDGLQSFELLMRLRRNLVGPFCHFASSSGPRWPEVADACRVPERQRHPVPILAVLGNHDYNSEESPLLQRDTVPEFVDNWSVPEFLADSIALGDDLSVVRLDSETIGAEGIADTVRLLLDRTRGRFRILVTHEPLALREGESPTSGSYKGLVRHAIEDAFRPPQLILAGHDHNLQVATVGLERPSLQVIAGSGSSRKPLKHPPYQERAFGMPTTGFARVDLMGRGAEQGLLVSLFSMPRYPIHFWREPRLVAKWWVRQNGEAERVYPSKS